MWRLEAKTIRGRLDGKGDGSGAADGTAPAGLALIRLGAVARGAPHEVADHAQSDLPPVGWLGGAWGRLAILGTGWLALIATAACVQLRLVCNLLDGMVAIEGGKSTATGALFNEIPDRLADPLFLVPLGYAAGYS